MKVRHGTRVIKSDEGMKRARGRCSHLGGKLVAVVVVDTGDRAIRSLAERARAVVHLVRQHLHYCRESWRRVSLCSNVGNLGVVHATHETAIEATGTWTSTCWELSQRHLRVW